MNHVDILMATYNGSPYVRNQILSIMGQTYQDWKLLIHDDGSTDDTLSIIKEFACMDARIQLIEDGIAKLGPGRNFMHLLQYSSAPFCCFCDQDDVWLEYKVSMLVAEIQRYDNTQPQVVYGNGYTWFPNSRLIGCHCASVFPKSLSELFFFNGGYQGASAIFNAEMKKRIDNPYRYVAMHDQILNLAGVIFGNIHFLNEGLFLYRQHEKNVTPHIVQNANERMKRAMVNKAIPVLQKEYFEGIKAFYEMHSSEMNPVECTLFNEFLACPSYSFWKRTVMIVKRRYKVNKSICYLLMKCSMRKFIS